MSRTYRDNGISVADWLGKPWHATGDHGRKFFTTTPKKFLKKLTASKNRAVERDSSFDKYEDIPSYKKLVSSYCIDWFRD